MATAVRPLGALERLFFRYGERNPVHFLLVVEFDVVLGIESVSAAPDSVQQRHPLLSVHVEDHPSTGLAFYRQAVVSPIALIVDDRAGIDWRSRAADELAHPFDRSTAPLMRATLLKKSMSSVLVLTFDHTIADGISSVLVLDDLIAALNGHRLEQLPVPPAIEDLINGSLMDIPAAQPAVHDQRMNQPTSQRHFDGTRPFLHAIEMTEADTTQLLLRCRTEQTTVHAALLSAACRVRGQKLGDTFVRALSPINIRELTRADSGCAAYFSGTCTGLAPTDETPFWEQARAISADLEGARSAAGVVGASEAIQQAMGMDASAATAEHVFSEVFAWELVVTNLGRQNLTNTGPFAPSAIWAPIVQMQTAGEHVFSVITYRGRLRMTCTGYIPTADGLESVLKVLKAASAD